VAGGGRGGGAERELHTECLSRAIVTRALRRTWCGRAALPSPSGGWGGGDERESRARAARNVPVSRERDAHVAAHTVLPRGAALPQRWLGRGRNEARVARSLPVSRDCNSPSAAHIVRPRGAACPQRRLEGRKRLQESGA
jgi:hypothetical protein